MVVVRWVVVVVVLDSRVTVLVTLVTVSVSMVSCVVVVGRVRVVDCSAKSSV